jgi:hypothetical protein
VKPLPDVIAIVERELAAAKAETADFDRTAYRPDFFARRREAMNALAARLHEEVGAKIVDRYDGARCRIAGFASSSTGGVQGAIQNWLTAARKRVA